MSLQRSINRDIQLQSIKLDLNKDNSSIGAVYLCNNVLNKPIPSPDVFTALYKQRVETSNSNQLNLT